MKSSHNSLADLYSMSNDDAFYLAKHPERNEFVVHGGAVHLSKESMIYKEANSFGRAVVRTQDGWGKLIPDMHMKSVSQEHGILSVPPSLFNKFAIGDLIYVLPVHSCLSANLMKYYLTTDGKIIEKFL